MKKLFLTTLLILAATSMVSAQNYIIINSEKVFKSLTEYNTALTTLDQLGKTYQDEVDKRFNDIETLYNAYIQQKTSLSASERNAYENGILAQEKQANEYQDSIFGNEGTLMKKRVEMIQPVQKKVFGAIEAYARQHGYDLVLDSANNAQLLYSNPTIDHTQQVINILK